MVAELGPGGVAADFDACDSGSPSLGEEHVIYVVAAVFAMPEIISGPSFFALALGIEMVIGAGHAVSV